MGRSHFLYRVGVPFENAAQLKEGLRALTEVDDASEGRHPRAPTKVAFVYNVLNADLASAADGLYRREPVVRAVLDRCEEVFQAEHGASLLDAMLGRSEANGSVAGAERGRGAVYAIECALTALWESVGVRPSVVVGQGVGEIAAAQAAGAVSLDDGLRLAVALSDHGQAPDVAIGPASMPLIRGTTGKAVESAKELDVQSFSIGQEVATAEIGTCVAAMAELGVDMVVQIGPDAGLGVVIESTWPRHSNSAEDGGVPVVLGGFMPARQDGASDPASEFVGAVACAYEAGIDIAFEGMFAGEWRSRISVPTYPFQRRRYWVEPVKRPA